MSRKKILQKLSILVTSMLIFSIITTSFASAATRIKVASNNNNYYSWCGIWIYSMGVEGNYVSNGRKITSYSAVKAKCSTGFSWNVCDKSAQWIYRGTKSGTCKAWATFRHGLNCGSVNLDIQSFDQSISAQANK